ncbi:DUF4158 domain-containing protein [Streptomyces sp. NBC_01294]|uniref:DUF4158 domain-containing protein n=1 Tax=Streptomyces sp. NBC_01294 TaxID=2903815 RepID=UPI003FA399E0
MGPRGRSSFFRLDAQALALAGAKLAFGRGRLGRAVQWGCARMLGVFPTEDVSVRAAAVRALREAEQLGDRRAGRVRRVRGAATEPA